MQQIEKYKQEFLNKFQTFSKEELCEVLALYAQDNDLKEQKIVKLQNKLGYPAEELTEIADQLVNLRHEIFGRSSEKRPELKDIRSKSGKKKNKKKNPYNLLPSLRYPDAPLVERTIELTELPSCKCCAGQMEKLPMTENSECLQVLVKAFHIIRNKRAKYRCPKCHGDIQTAPAMPRIKPGSSYSDEMMIDIAVSKYGDHMPIERYRVIAERFGLVGIPPQSLIECTHHLADFLEPVYGKLEKAVRGAKVLHADETSWKMLEGDPKKSWQLWGFFTEDTSFHMARDTRAAKVAIDFLKECEAEYLVTDAYQGYARSTNGTEIKNIFCNAHARRGFIKAEINYPEAGKMINWYKELYKIEKQLKNKPPDLKREVRQKMSLPIFKKMGDYLQNRLDPLPKSQLGRAKNYFFNHYRELTRYLEDGRIPIDNNLAERGLRGAVVGRKNYYGNHSRRGARTTSILYSIIESCKVNKINPQKYLQDIVQMMHNHELPLTPVEYSAR